MTHRLTPSLFPFVLATLASLAALPAATVRAAESYDGCRGFIASVPAVISTQGVWCLRQDVSTSATSGAAITVNTNNVTIDCNGFKIGGLAAGSGTNAAGISASNRQNLTVRNCTARGFLRGIHLAGGANALIEDNRFDNNLLEGIRANTESTIVRRNIVNDTGSGPTRIGDVSGIAADAAGLTIRDNIVHNVIAGAKPEAQASGIRVGGSGGVIEGNIVRNIVPKGGLNAYGVYLTNNAVAGSVRDNRLILSQPTATPGLGVRCSATAPGSVRDNLIWGFAASVSAACHGDGGNNAH